MTASNVVEKLLSQASRFQGFDTDRFKRCIAERSETSKVEADISLGMKLGVNATPSVFVDGRRVPGDSLPEQILTLVGEQTDKAGRSNK